MKPRSWLWPNLLSLDAPIVALLWQVFFVRCFRGEMHPLTGVLLPVAVWLIYSLDRILDHRRGAGTQARHQFFGARERVILPFWMVMAAVGGWIAWEWLPQDMLAFGVLLGAAVALYLAAVHSGRLTSRGGSKEAVVAVVFAIGTSLAAWRSIRTFHDVLTILLFSALCWINCVAIEDLENGCEMRSSAVLAAVGVAVLAGIFLRSHRPILGAAETASALGLLALGRARGRLPDDALRVLADVTLLSPLLFWTAAGMGA